MSTAQPSTGTAALPRTILPTTTHKPAENRSFGRLVATEFRKLVDTRAGMWLLIAMGVLTVAITFASTMIAGYLYRGDGPMATEKLQLVGSSMAGAGVMGTFVGILAILTIAGEWGQRTTLSTFSLEPRRGRVLLAKALVILAVGLLVWAISFPIGALAMAVAHAVFHAGVSYSVTAASLFGSCLAMLLGGAVFGAALGLLFQNSAAAIVTYLVLPMIMPMLNLITMAWKPWENVMKWGNPANAQGPFMGDWHLADFGPLASTTLIWIVLPAAFGTWRWLRRECK